MTIFWNRPLWNNNHSMDYCWIWCVSQFHLWLYLSVVHQTKYKFVPSLKKSNNLKQCQTMSNNIKQCQTISNNIEQCQTISNNIEQCQTISINFIQITKTLTTCKKPNNSRLWHIMFQSLYYILMQLQSKNINSFLVIITNIFKLVRCVNSPDFINLKQGNPECF